MSSNVMRRLSFASFTQNDAARALEVAAGFFRGGGRAEVFHVGNIRAVGDFLDRTPFQILRQELDRGGANRLRCCAGDGFGEVPAAVRL